MVVLTELLNLGKIAAFVVKIPETAGLMMFGVILIVAAVLARWLLNRSETSGGHKGLDKRI